MKEGWKSSKLLDICRVINGRAYLKPEMLSEGKYRILRVGNFFTNDSWYYSDLELEDDKYCEDGDLLYAWSASFGPRIWHGEKVIYHYHIWKMICSNVLDKYYMCYWLDSDALKKQVMNKLHGATMTHITKGIMENCYVTYPPLSEQHRIVSYLDTSFAQIDALAKQAEESVENAKALFQATLKELMEKKEGWEEKKLGEIASDSADGPFGSNLKKEHYTTERQVRIIQLSNIGEEGWREDNTKYTTFEHLKNISRSEVEPNDIVIAKMMPAGRAIICPNHERKFVLSSDAVKIKLKKGYLTKFILYSINSPYFRNEVYENVTGSGRVRTSLTKLRECTLRIPSLEEQESIVNILDTLSANISRLQSNYTQTLANCQALKQALLRETFE